MALQEAYGQTDVMNDPRYLASLRGRAGEQARAAYETRQNQAARLAQQRAEFNIRQQQTAETGRTTAQDREDKQRALEEYRQHQIGLRQDAQKAAKMEQLRLFLTNPPTNTPPSEVENVRNQYYAAMGIQRGLTPQQEAENKLRAAKGQPLIQPPGAGTPGGPQFPATGTPGGPPVSAGGAAPAAAPPIQRQNFGLGSSAEFNVQQAVGGEQTSAPYYNPSVGANMVRTSSGREIVVGGPDPSVGATETAVRTPLVGGGQQLNFPSGGIARSGVAGETRAARALREPMFAPAETARDWTTGAGRVGPTPEKPLSETALPNIQPATVGTNAGGAGRGVGLVNQPAPPGTPEQAPPGSVYNASTPVGGPVRGFFRNMGIRFPPEVAWDPNDVGKPNAWNVPPHMRGPNAGVQPVPESQPQFAPSNLAPGTGPFGHPVPQLGAAAPGSPAQNPPPIAGQSGTGTLPIRPVPLPQLPPPTML